MPIINYFPSGGSKSHVYEDDFISIELVNYTTYNSEPPVFTCYLPSAASSYTINAGRTQSGNFNTTRRAIGLDFYVWGKSNTWSCTCKLKFKHSYSNTIRLGTFNSSSDPTVAHSSLYATSITPVKGDVYTMTLTQTISSSNNYSVDRVAWSVTKPDGTVSSKNGVSGYAYILLVLPSYSKTAFSD